MNVRHETRSRALAGLTMVLALAAAAGAADARAYRTSPSEPMVDGSLVQVEVRVDGESLPFYMRPGYSDRHYFEAFDGRNYSVVVHNTSDERVGVLMTVDGLNVVNGGKSKLDNREAMYVLDPYETATISGWRTSLDEVRRFVFVDEDASYAERTGQANSDLGWIRVLAYRESRPWWAPPRLRPDQRYRDSEPGLPGNELAPRSQAPAPAPNSLQGPSVEKSAPEADRLRGGDSGSSNDPGNPGTGWGDRSYDRVNRTDFAAAKHATDQIILRYEYEDGLRQLGIDIRGDRLWDRELGFARPPRW